MIDWTHDQTTCPRGKSCTGTTECEAFPTRTDRINQARAAYEQYAEADGTSLNDFVQDVLMLAGSEGVRNITGIARRVENQFTGDHMVDWDTIRDMARTEYVRDGEIEIDEDAIVSEGDDPGAYVEAWVWVAWPECNKCGEQHLPSVECADSEDQSLL